MSSHIEEQVYEQAAEQLHVEVAAIKAVVEVDTGNRGGFIAEGTPIILFEGHVFWRQLQKRGISPAMYQKGNEDILYPKWTTKYYRRGMEEYARLERARIIHREAADASASWGLVQIMGFNYAICGCKTITEFVDLMSVNEASQLDLFVRFIKGNKWDVYLRNKDWVSFACRYNGPGYAQNKYDKKLAVAYEKYKSGIRKS